MAGRRIKVGGTAGQKSVSRDRAPTRTMKNMDLELEGGGPLSRLKFRRGCSFKVR